MQECYRDYFWLNGELLPISQCNDQFLKYGKTIYEVIRVKDCVPLFLEKYLLRLQMSLMRAGEKLWFPQEQIVSTIKQIIQANRVKQADSLKLVLSFDNDFSGKKQNIFAAYMMRNNAPTEKERLNGVHCVTVKAQRSDPHIKIFDHNLRSLTKAIIEQNQAYEAILLTEEDKITEGSRSNIFFVSKHNFILTPELKDVLPGVTRSNVIELARQNDITVIENTIPYSALPHFDAVFITGTSRKILPVKSIDNYTFNTRNKLMRTLMKLYDEKIENYIKSNKSLWPDC